MGTQGDLNTNKVNTQVQSAVSQSNLPKSPLAQQLSNWLGQNAGSIFGQMQGAQNIGGQFMGGSYNMPTSMSGGQRYNNPFASRPYQQPQLQQNFNYSGPQSFQDTPQAYQPVLGDRLPFTYDQATGNYIDKQSSGIKWSEDAVRQFASQNPQLVGSQNVPGNIGAPVSGKPLQEIDGPGIGSQNPQSFLAQTAGGNNQLGGILGKIANGEFNLPQQGQNQPVVNQQSPVNVSYAGTPQSNLDFTFDPTALQTLTSSASQGIGQLLSQLQFLSAPQVNPGSFNNGAINPQDSAYYQGVTDLFNRQQDKDLADLRERYGAMGNGLGTGVFNAEAAARAEAYPQLQSALGAVRQQEVGNELNRRGLDLSARGQDINAMLGNAANILQTQAQNNSALLGGGSLNLQGASEDTARALGLLGQQNQFYGNQMNYALGNRQLDSAENQFNSNWANQFGMQNMNNQYGWNMQQMQNQFAGLQGLFNMLGQFGLAGIPGGNTNVSMSPMQNQPFDWGGFMNGAGQVIGAVGDWRGGRTPTSGFGYGGYR